MGSVLWNYRCKDKRGHPLYIYQGLFPGEENQSLLGKQPLRCVFPPHASVGSNEDKELEAVASHLVTTRNALETCASHVSPSPPSPPSVSAGHLLELVNPRRHITISPNTAFSFGSLLVLSTCVSDNV